MTLNERSQTAEIVDFAAYRAGHARRPRSGVETAAWRVRALTSRQAAHRARMLRLQAASRQEPRQLRLAE
jgi:hypothetical protein